MKLINKIQKNKRIILINFIFLVILILLQINQYFFISLFIGLSIISYGSYSMIQKLKLWNKEKKNKILDKRQKLMDKYYKTEKKIEKNYYQQKIIDSLENIIQVSRKSKFKDIQEIATTKLEFCKDTGNIKDLRFNDEKEVLIIKKINLLTEKANNIYLKRDYITSIDYWNEIIDLYNLLLENMYRPYDRNKIYENLFKTERKIIKAYIVRSEKYCSLAKNAIKKEKYIQAKDNLIASIDSYQNTLAELKRYKLLFDDIKENKILRNNKIKLDDFNIVITSKGIKMKFFNTETDLNMHFPSERETLSDSIQLCFNSIETLKQNLVNSNIMNFIPNQIILQKK